MYQPTVSTRRRFPRIEVTLPVEIEAESGSVFHVTTKNISQTGLLIVTDRMIFEQLTLNQRLAEKSQLAEVNINMTLPVAGGEEIGICASCRLFQIRRVARDCYYIGLEYQGLPRLAHDGLMRYIQSVIDGGTRQLCQTTVPLSGEPQRR